MASGDFIPNPHLQNHLLTVTHNPDTPKGVKPGHVMQAITLQHISWRPGNKKRVRQVTLGWVPTKKITPKTGQHKIMTNCFGVDKKENLIVRDRHILQGLVEVLGEPFTLVSNRSVRGKGLIEWALENSCTAVYTPEGYDEYLLEQLQDEIKKRNLKLVLITQIDGGVVQVN